MTSQSAPSPFTHRRWYQFSLGALLLLVLVCSLFLAWIGWISRQLSLERGAALQAIEAAEISRARAETAMRETEQQRALAEVARQEALAFKRVLDEQAQQEAQADLDATAPPPTERPADAVSPALPP